MALVIKKNGKPVNASVLAAIVGWLMAKHGYEAELVELPEKKR